MNKYISDLILENTGAPSVTEVELLQELWSGYGEIMRVRLEGAPVKSVILKHIRLNQQNDHPRGWNTDIGHQRKLRSYEVEANWYRTYSRQSAARLPDCLAIESSEDREILILMEDLDEAGFPVRRSSVSWDEIELCLQWLAQFHAGFLGKDPDGLWETGTYWHLETRPQELNALDDIKLKNAAPLIERKLKNCEFKTFVHGDAKLANFCFSDDGKVAAVDFQYVGGGCGMKDLAYFIGSCMDEAECERLESQILDTYFQYFHEALGRRNKALESEWRSMYRLAWADFHRFLKGWSPGHWKINSYSERITNEVINTL